MKITNIKIKNILGIENLEINPGDVTIITGGNGAGKTSVLAALKLALGGGGNHAMFMRQGSDVGEVVLEMDNGDILTKTVIDGESKIELKTEGGLRIPRAVSVLKERISHELLNPIEFLHAKQKEQIKLLLGAVPMKMPTDEIMAITSVDVADQTQHPLAVIEQVRAKIYDDRTITGREIKRIGGSIESMEQVTATDDEENPETIREGLDNLRSAKDDLLRGKEAVNDFESKKLADRVAHLKVVAQQGIDKIKEAMAVDIEAAQAEKDTALAVASTDSEAKIEDLVIRITEAEEKIKLQDKMAAALALCASQTKELIAHNSTKDVYDQQILGLDNLKAELLENVPIKGFELLDGEIMVNGFKFATLNQAERIRFALSVAVMNTPQLPICCVDGIEALDTDTFAIFEKEARDNGIQLFVCMVTNDREGLKVTAQ